jgi:DNA-binding FadR family transcriptional regulator
MQSVMHSDRNVRQAMRLLASVCKRICEGALEAGDRVPVQKEWSRQLKVSLAAARLGMSVLADLEIVQVRNKRGTFVSTEARESIASGFERLARSHAWQSDCLSRVTPILAGYAAMRAAISFRAREHVKLADALSELYRASRHPKEYCLYELEFQRIVAASVRSPILCSLLERNASAICLRSWELKATPELLHWSAQQYRGIFWAIREGEPQDACQRMQRYVKAAVTAESEHQRRDPAWMPRAVRGRRAEIMLGSGFAV